MAARIRKFLVVLDKTPECRVALRFAARRAQHTGGRVTLLCAVHPAEFQQWRGVEEIMQDEALQDAENLLHAAAKTVNELAGIMPELVSMEGSAAECLVKLINEDRDISILVVGAGAGKEGPGPLVTMFASGVQAIPVTIVPGTFDDAAIDAMA